MDNIQFEDRVTEIEEYIRLLCAIEEDTNSGKPSIGGSKISTGQQKMLYSAVFLQLYNLIEATANWCISAVAEATVDDKNWQVGQLIPEVRQEWIRTNFRTHAQINESNRISHAINACDYLINNQPIEKWEIQKGGGGSWDDVAIDAVSDRVGCELVFNPATKTEALRPFRNELNALRFVKDLRNKLAHGSISFEQSGENVTAHDLLELKNRTVNYLREVVQSYGTYIEALEFLAPPFRPSNQNN